MTLGELCSRELIKILRYLGVAVPLSGMSLA